VASLLQAHRQGEVGLNIAARAEAEDENAHGLFRYRCY
jgi:hypothetical protein